MAFMIALLLAVAFTANVVAGAIGSGPLVSNVSEMLILLAASVAFVVGILQREAQAEAAEKNK
ncbi:hypothetical protein [Anianabacter salinae]|uniref:hypothetical protein n=1 Tax=Anianabacter salinae TaxID=2851023 RepID=UPI00225DCFB7|nr:hypothetical protein [Anianabacter salinae]MBV0914244.1 hypothetical protein [Anianabacter salinae]